MCQPKELGGRRCRGKGKSSFYPQSLEKDLPMGAYICPQCGQQNTRGVAHHCPLKNVLNDSQQATQQKLVAQGIPTYVDATDIRKILDARAKGDPDPEVTLKVDVAHEEAVKCLKENGSLDLPHGSVTFDAHSGAYSIDALSYDVSNGNIVDIHGGLADMREGIIRHVTPFEDNPASVLHGAVLASQTGYSVAPETLLEAQATSHLYETIPKAQVWEQWEDISLSATPSKALQAIHDMGWESNFPELAAMRGVPQSPFWHPEGSVEIHIQQAADVAAKMAEKDGLSEKERSIVVMAAISHDLGKAVSTTIDDEGNINSYGHESTGIPLARKFLKDIGAKGAMLDQVPALVGCHMHHATEPTEKSIRRLSAKLEENGKGATMETWARLAEADQAGRGSAGVYGVREKWLTLTEQVRKKDSMKAIPALVNGNFLQSQGYKPGEKFREIIVAAGIAKNNGEISNEQEAKQWLDKNFPLT